MNTVSVETAPILELEQITKRFTWQLDVASRVANLLGAGLQERAVHAVTPVDLAIRVGEVVGLVGGSGGGKSTHRRIVAATTNSRHQQEERLVGRKGVNKLK